MPAAGSTGFSPPDGGCHGGSGGRPPDTRAEPGRHSRAAPCFFALTGAISPDGAFCLKIIKCG